MLQKARCILFDRIAKRLLMYYPNVPSATYRSRRSHRHFRRVFMEHLESRHMLAAITWDGGGDGVNWSDALNWSSDVLPGAADDVTIDFGSNTVQHDAGADTIHSLTNTNPLTLAGGNLAVISTIQVNNSFTLSGGMLSGGVVNFADGQMLSMGSNSANRLTGVTVNGDLDLSEDDARITIAGGTTFLNAHLSGSRSAIAFDSDQTLTGNILFEGPKGDVRNVAMVSPGTLTIGPTGSIRTVAGLAGQGFIGNIASRIGGGYGGAMSVVNQGLISAEASGVPLDVNFITSLTNAGTLQVKNGGALNARGLTGNTNTVALQDAGSSLNLDGTNYVLNEGVSVAAGQAISLNGTWTNAMGSTITATDAIVTLGNASNAWSNLGNLNLLNSTLNLGGSVTTAGLNLPSVSCTNGTVNLQGTLNNTNSTLFLNSSPGSWNIAGGTIAGGNISTINGAQLFATGSGGTLDGVTLNGDLDLNNYSASLAILNGLTLNGTANLEADAVRLIFVGTQTLSGNGTVIFGGDNIPESGLITGTNGMTFTIGSGITMRGGSYEFAGGSASIGYHHHAGGSPNVTIINKGTIDADAPGKTLRLTATGELINQGSLKAENGGTLLVDGLRGDAGNVSLTGAGSQMQLNGTDWINNRGLSALAGTTLTLNGTWTNPSNLIANNGVINLSGTFTNSGTLESTNGGAFNGVLKDNAGTVEISDTGGNLILDGANYGNITMSNGATLAPPSSFTNHGQIALLTNASLTLDGASYGNYFVASGATLTSTPPFINRGQITLSAAGRLVAPGSFTQEPTGSLRVEIGGSEASGLFGHLETPGLAALSGSLDIGVVDGYTPQAGDGYTIASFDTRSGVFAPITGLYANREQLFEAALLPNELRINALQDAADLQVVSMNIPSDGVAGQDATVSYTVINAASTPISATSWVDSIYLSSDGIYDPADKLIGRVQHTGAVDAMGSYSDSLTAPLPGVIPGLYHVIVISDSRGVLPDLVRSNDTLVSTATMNVDIPTLAIGTTTTGTIREGQDIYFRLVVPTGDEVQLETNFATTSEAELYRRYAAVPDRTQYDELVFDQSQLQPRMAWAAPPGTTYILLHGREGAANDQSFSITPSQAVPALSSFNLAEGSNQGSVTMTIRGSGFSPTTKARLVAGDVIRDATSVDFQDSTTLVAKFDLTGLTAGAFTIQVYEDESHIFDFSGSAAVFNVTDSNPGKLDVSISTPPVVGIGAKITATFSYRNSGGSDIPPLTLIVKVTNADPSSFPIFINELPPGASGSATFTFQSSPAREGTVSNFTISVAGNSGVIGVGPGGDEDPQKIDWDQYKDQMRPDSVDPAAWNIIFANFVSRVGDTIPTFNATMVADSNYLRQIGANLADVSNSTSIDLSALLGFEFTYADNALPARSLTSATDADAPVPSLPLQFVRTDMLPISNRFQLGSLGRGWVSNWDISIAPDSSGNVIVTEGAATRSFQRGTGGLFKASTGDFGKLSLINGTYRLLEKDGTLLVFRTDGKLDYVQDANGNSITASYTNGLLTGLTHSSGAAFTLAYNSQGRLIQLTDEAGRVTTYSYDATGDQLLSVSGPHGTTSYSYSMDEAATSDNALTSITNIDGSHLYFTYDSHGMLVHQENDGGVAAVTYTYISPGTLKTSDADGTTTTLFDQLGQVRSTRDPLGRTTSIDYDENNQPIKVHLPENLSSSLTYDSHGNVISTIDPLGNETDFSYSSDLNQLTRLVDARGNSLYYGYDTKGNLQSITYPDGTSEQFDVDGIGNPIDQINRRGQASDYTYDARGLVTHESFSDGSYTDFTYDNRGNLLTATDPTGTTSLVWDAADRMIRITYPNGRFLSFTYDAGNRRTQMVDQDGSTVNYAYDAAGRLSGLTDGNGTSIVTYTYDAVGRLSRKDNGNGTYTTYAYDAASELLHLVNFAPDGTVNSRFDYTYDDLGRRISMGTLDGQWTYTYDAIGELTHAVFASLNAALVPNQDLTYVYDAVGNRIRTIENGVTTEYATNALNEYTSVGTSTLGYDADGNLISKVDGGSGTVYSYDNRNRLVSVVTPSDTWTYEYDSLGNRIATTHNGQRTEYLLDPGGMATVVGQYNIGSTTTNYVNGLGLVSQADTSGDSAYYDFDALGSTIGISNQTGAYVNTYGYLPYGQTMTRSETLTNPYQFMGQYGITGDDSGTDYMRARDYSTDLGRFFSNDPLGVRGGEANLYMYVSNQPIERIDPVGLYSRNDSPSFSNQSNNSQLSESPSNPFLQPRSLTSSDLKVLAAGVAFATVAIVAVETAPLWAPLVIGGYQYVAPFAFGFLVDAIYFSETPWGQIILGGIKSEIGETGQLPTFYEFFGGILFDLKGDSQTEQAGRPIDPNDIIGPAGFGTPGYIKPQGTLPYTIRFENDPSATAPAQAVVVTQQLDSDLDWSTFELGDFGFGNLTVHVPEGRSNYSTRLDLRDTLGEFVDFTAGIEMRTGVVTWIITSVDPETGDLPTNPFGGFLPPNVTPPEGDGFVSYRVRAKSNAPSGTRLDAEASIVFNSNDPIPTPSIYNTIDTGPPSSQVNALPAAVYAQSFTVNWSGDDNSQGSGIGSYDIYVSTDGGTFSVWKKGTTDTAGTFDGQFGHTYRFYSVATDNVGNTELPATIADATTQTVDPTPTSIGLSVNSVPENLSGTAVGTLSAPSADKQDTVTYTVTDSRFEITGGILQLKTGNALSRTDGTQISIDVTATVSSTPPLSLTKTLTIVVDANPFPWHNQANHLDVDNDGHISPVDALIIINELNNPKISIQNQLPTVRPTDGTSRFYDANADGFVAPIDALLVIDFINANGPSVATSDSPNINSLTADTNTETALLASPAFVVAFGSLRPEVPNILVSSFANSPINLGTATIVPRPIPTQTLATPASTPNISQVTSVRNSLIPTALDWENSIDEFANDVFKVRQFQKRAAESDCKSLIESM